MTPTEIFCRVGLGAVVGAGLTYWFIVSYRGSERRDWNGGLGLIAAALALGFLSRMGG